MCGICGIYNFINNANEEDTHFVKKMMTCLKHRGPDSDGIIKENKCTLGFVRLSIIDLSSEGNQPMKDDSGRYSLVFNGEIYNYIELRTELIDAGFKFRSKSDTEVLLYSYIQWKEKALDKLNGMFAFAIYDNVEKSLFAARDRYGIKPFYYYKSETQFIFSSEIIPIIKFCMNKREINNEAVYNYLVYNRTDYDNSTFIKDINKIGHGTYIKIYDNKFIETKWYDLNSKIKNYQPDKNNSFRELFKSSIKLRMRSDVPLGLCLSGGLDSSSIASVMLYELGLKNLNTFSAVYDKDFKYDERKYIEKYSSSLNNMYYTTPDYETLFADKEKFVTAIGEPIPSTSPYAQFKVMELASKYVKVTLDGQGADEELGGYHYFFGVYFKELLLKLRIIKLFSEFYGYYKNHKSFYGFKTFIFFMLNPSLMDEIRVRERNYLNKDFISSGNKRLMISENLYNSTTLNESLVNHFEYKLEHLLKWEDRNSMYFSIEARLPFLDYRIVEYLLSQPSDKKINKGTTKYLLRESMKDILPKEILKRHSKIGFDTPEADWFREKIFRDYIFDLLSSTSFKNRGYFVPEKCISLYEKHLKKDISISKEIWKWINFELWMKMIDSI